MSNDLNSVQIIGRLGKDPESRRLNNGSQVVNLTVASGETWKDKSTGERKEKTEWFQVVIWSEGLAKVAEQYLKKGSRVYIQGKLQTRKWQDQSGADKYTTEVVLQGFDSKLIMLDGKPAEQREERPQQELREYSSQPARGGYIRDDDEIPF